MRKLQATENITPSRSFPIKGGTLGFLQYAYAELFAELIQELYPQQNAFVRAQAVRGCSFTGSNAEAYELQPGAIFIGGNFAPVVEPYGELFLLPAVQNVIAAPSGSWPILVIGTTYYSPSSGIADPVTFSDNSSISVHAIRTLTLVNGNSSTDGFVCFLDGNNYPGDGAPYLLPTIPVGYTIYTEALLQVISQGTDNTPIMNIIFNGTGLTFSGITRGGIGVYNIALSSGTFPVNKTVLITTGGINTNGVVPETTLNSNLLVLGTVDTDSFGNVTILVRIYN